MARVKVAYWVLRSSLLVEGIAVVLFYTDGLAGFLWYYVGNFGANAASDSFSNLFD